MKDGSFERLRIPLDDDTDLAGPDQTPLEPIGPDYSSAVSPRQLAAGFAIVAALVVLLFGVRRRRRGSPSGPESPAEDA
jgi:hypothetical protein